MITHRKKNFTKPLPLEPLEGRLLSCYYQDGRITLASSNQREIDALAGHGYGKGTLSRGAPSFKERLAAGLKGAPRDDPFATPVRYASSSASPSTPPLEVESTQLHAAEIEEDFQLGREEALYLAIRFNAVSISQGPHSPALQPPDLLKLFNTDQNNFLARYFVYQHYRNLGWVVKLGGKNGVDFLLYSLGGPVNAHAQYGVKLHLSEESPSEQHTVPWQVSTRVLDTVAKSLLIAIVSPGWTEGHMAKSDFVLEWSKWTLDELALCRWDVNTSSRV